MFTSSRKTKYTKVSDRSKASNCKNWGNKNPNSCNSSSCSN